MSTMEQTTQELQSHISSQSVPQPPQNIDFHGLATQQVQQLPDLDPCQTQLATFLAKLQIKSDHESKLARHLLEKSLMTTVNAVNSHTQEISNIRQFVDTVQAGQAELGRGQADILSKLAQINSLATKVYFTAAETKTEVQQGELYSAG